MATSEAATASATLEWLRLVTSAHMRAHQDEFAPYCADERRSFEAFLAEDVETMGVEADEMQVQALTTALELRIRIEYLDSSAANLLPWSERCGLHRFVVCGPQAFVSPQARAAAAAEARLMGATPATTTGPPLVACLLFRPGHYDVLTPRDWSDTVLTAADPREGSAFVPPLPPPRDPPPRPCGNCGRPSRLCVLCAEVTCTSPECFDPRLLSAAERREPFARCMARVGGERLQVKLPADFGALSEHPTTVCATCLLRLPVASAADPAESPAGNPAGSGSQVEVFARRPLSQHALPLPSLSSGGPPAPPPTGAEAMLGRLITPPHRPS